MPDPATTNGLGNILGISGLAGGSLGTGILLKIIFDWLKGKKNGNGDSDKILSKLEEIKTEIHDTRMSNDRTEQAVNKLVSQSAATDVKIQAILDKNHE